MNNLEGLRNWLLKIIHRDVDCSMKNIVRNFEIIGYGTQWVFGHEGNHSDGCMVFWPPCCTYETGAEWFECKLGLR